MAFNYGNIENMLPLFGSISNTGGVANHPNFISQLAAAITTAVGAANATPTSTTAMSKRERTPEPPPAPKFSSPSPVKMKPNQGTAPMDLENDSDADTNSTPAPSTKSSSTNMSNKMMDKMPLNMPDPNLFLNSFLPSGMNPSAFMFFPPAAAAATTTTTTAATGQMLMDPTAMMAAMQQMQQSYAGYTTALPTAAAADSSIESGSQLTAGGESYAPAMKEVIKTKNCILFPPNPNAPPPTIRERPPGCRTVFVGGLPENITEEIIREIFESCGEITTLRMSKKNFCHIRYRHEASIDRAIYLSGYRVRISNMNEPANFGRLHVDYAQARDDKYDYECKQRQLQREQRHRERVSLDRIRSQSPPPTPHYTDHEASLVAENLRSNDTFIKAIQTISIWLERGDCTKRNANIFYSMIQSTHAHVRRLYTDKQQLEEDLRKARESYRKQMLTMSTQFTQIEKVFSAASHKKVWDHFTKAQRKNIDQWKKLASELRSVQIEDDEMEMSDDDRDYQSSSTKRARYDSENLKEENDSLRCQLEALRGEMSLVRTDIKYDSDFREKQIKVLQETIRNMQTQLLQTKMREQKDAKTIEQLERKLKEAGVKQLLLKTKIRETAEKLKDKEVSSLNSETSEILVDEVGDEDDEEVDTKANNNHELKMGSGNATVMDNTQIIDIDVYKSDDDVKIIEDNTDIVEIHEIEDDEKCKQQGNQEEKTGEGEENQTENKETEKEDMDVASTEHKQLVDASNVPENEPKESKSLVLLEAKIIALVSAFLVVHPFGAYLETICNYLHDFDEELKLQSNSLETMLATYKNLFSAEAAKHEKNTDPDVKAKVRWKFCGFTQANANTMQ